MEVRGPLYTSYNKFVWAYHVFDESLRLFPFVPFDITRKTAQESWLRL